jgi:heptosyltransferase-3
MKPALERLPIGGRVAVIRLRSLGDCVLTTPALQILNEFRPDLRIAVVVEARFAAVFEHHPAISRILPPSARALAAWRPGLTLNFHGGTRSILLTLASRARLRAGFAHYRARWAYNVVLPRAQEVVGEERKVHTAEHLASAMFYLGAARRDVPRASLFADPWPRPRPYALIHPFASSPDKAWPAERFAAVARHLRDRVGLEPIVLCGPADNPAPFGEFTTLESAPLAQVKSAIRSAALFVANDSGPAHMATALGVPLVVLFGPSDAVVWAPWKPVAAESIVRPSIDRITLEEVLGAVERLGVHA